VLVLVLVLLDIDMDIALWPLNSLARNGLPGSLARCPLALPCSASSQCPAHSALALAAARLANGLASS
jgi:hypothetical protein